MRVGSDGNLAPTGITGSNLVGDGQAMQLSGPGFPAAHPAVVNGANVFGGRAA